MNLLDAPAEDRYCRLTRLACKLFDAPFSMLTFLDEERQWFKSAQGHLIIETPKTESFCQYTINYGGPMVVEDAVSDSRFVHLPVVAQMGIRFYAGVPIFGQKRQPIGTLCILDHKPRAMDPANMESLMDLARCVQSELKIVGYIEMEQRLLAEMDELRRKANVDPVARCWNAAAGAELLSRLKKERPFDSRQTLVVVLLSLERLAAVNKTLGTEAGEFYLRESANVLRRVLPESACLARAQSTSFMVIYPQIAAERIRTEGEQLSRQLTGRSILLPSGQQVPLDVCAGLAAYSSAQMTDEELVARAYQALYKAKDRGPGTLIVGF